MSISLIKHYIKQSEKKALSESDILNITNNQVKIISYPQLSTYYNIDQVLSPFNATILLYENKVNQGHWCLLLKYDNYLEFFDPYGMFPDKELGFISTNFRIENNEFHPHLSFLISKSNYILIYNKCKLQQFRNDISTCGRWCSIRVVFRDIPLKDFQSMFKNKRVSPDQLVTVLSELTNQELNYLLSYIYNNVIQ